MTSREMTPFLSLPGDNDGAGSGRRSVSDILHMLVFGAIGWPWLVRSLHGGTQQAKRDLLHRLELVPDALPHLGSWKADTGFLHLIVDHILAHRPETVVEFGTGASSLVIGRALQQNRSGRLISCDQHQDFVDSTRAWLNEHGIEAELRTAPLRPAPAGWPGLWYDHGILPARIDLLIVDGPPWAIHPFGRGAADSLFDRLPVGGTVLLDDGARPGERVVARRWRKRWPNFEFRLVHAGTKGTLIGTRLY